MAELVADLMSRDAVVVRSADHAGFARGLAAEHGVHHLLVVDGHELVGITCLCDLDWAFEDDSVARRMRTSLGSARPRDSIAHAASAMIESGLACLPVLGDSGELVGVLTRSDLRRRGVLPGERGVDSCAACGAEHCSLAANCPDAPVFCLDCLDQVRGKGVRELYFTLGGGD
jgi:predicted transcriptional regulator